MQIYLGLVDVFCESLSILPMAMDVGADLILGWDWIWSHDLLHLFQEEVCFSGWDTHDCS